MSTRNYKGSTLPILRELVLRNEHYKVIGRQRVKGAIVEVILPNEANGVYYLQGIDREGNSHVAKIQVR